jgi:GGDEF domain-containing protein
VLPGLAARDAVEQHPCWPAELAAVSPAPSPRARPHHVTASIGAPSTPGRGDFRALLHTADLRMYVDKRPQR